MRRSNGSAVSLERTWAELFLQWRALTIVRVCFAPVGLRGAGGSPAAPSSSASSSPCDGRCRTAGPPRDDSDPRRQPPVEPPHRAPRRTSPAPRRNRQRTMNGAFLRRRDRTVRSLRVEHYSSAVDTLAGSSPLRPGKIGLLGPSVSRQFMESYAGDNPASRSHHAGGASRCKSTKNSSILDLNDGEKFRFSVRSSL